MLLKGFWPLCNVTRSSMLVIEGVLYLPLRFVVVIIISIIFIIIVIIMIILLLLLLLLLLLISILLLMSFLLFLLSLELLSRAVYCSYEVS